MHCHILEFMLMFMVEVGRPGTINPFTGGKTEAQRLPRCTLSRKGREQTLKPHLPKQKLGIPVGHFSQGKCCYLPHQTNPEISVA